jgi:hypothetical protein
VLPQQVVHPGVEGGLLRVRGPLVALLGLLLQAGNLPPAGAHQLEALPAGDGHQPGADPLRVPDLVEMLERAQPGVLHDILGIGLR